MEEELLKFKNEMLRMGGRTIEIIDSDENLKISEIISKREEKDSLKFVKMHEYAKSMLGKYIINMSSHIICHVKKIDDFIVICSTIKITENSVKSYDEYRFSLEHFYLSFNNKNCETKIIDESLFKKLFKLINNNIIENDFFKIINDEENEHIKVFKFLNRNTNTFLINSLTRDLTIREYREKINLINRLTNQEANDYLEYLRKKYLNKLIKFNGSYYCFVENIYYQEYSNYVKFVINNVISKINNEVKIYKSFMTLNINEINGIIYDSEPLNKMRGLIDSHINKIHLMINNQLNSQQHINN